MVCSHHGHGHGHGFGRVVPPAGLVGRLGCEGFLLVVGFWGRKAGQLSDSLVVHWATGDMSNGAIEVQYHGQYKTTEFATQCLIVLTALHCHPPAALGTTSPSHCCPPPKQNHRRFHEWCSLCLAAGADLAVRLAQDAPAGPLAADTERRLRKCPAERSLAENLCAPHHHPVTFTSAGLEASICSFCRYCRLNRGIVTGAKAACEQSLGMSVL